MASKQTKITTTKSVTSTPSPTFQKKQAAATALAEPVTQMAFSLKDLQEEFAKQSLELGKQSQKIQDELKEQRGDWNKFKEEIQDENRQLRKDLITVLQFTKQNAEETKKKIEEVEDVQVEMQGQLKVQKERLDSHEAQFLAMQFKEMEFALRIRGIPEDRQLNLEQVCAEGMAEIIEWQPDHVMMEIERIFRVNSRMARENKLPRDVVVYFRGKRLRNLIAQASYNKRMQINGRDVIILKEIPPKILRMRKDYAFLVDELKKRQLRFRWEIPIGIILSFNGKRYVIKTVEDAREFYHKVLQGKPEEVAEPKLAEVASAKPQEEVFSLALTEEDLQSIQGSSDLRDIKEQRITRAAYKKMEQRQEKKQEDEGAKCSYAEVVGGARPKSKPQELDLVLQRLLGHQDDQ